jgi:hypothetical protein
MPPPSPPVIQPRPRALNTVAKLWWSAPLNDGGTPITEYRISYDTTVVSGISPEQTSYTLTGLTNGVDYTFSMVAINADGPSEQVFFRTIQTGSPPGTSTGATYTSDVSGTLTVIWTPPVSDGGAAVRWNVATCVPIDISGQPTTIVKKTFFGGSNGTGYIYGLDPLKAYQILLQPVNDPGYSFKEGYLDTVFWGADPASYGTLAVWLDAANPKCVLDANGKPCVASGNYAQSWVSVVNSHAFVNNVGSPIRYDKSGLDSRFPGIAFTEATQVGFELAAPSPPLIQSNTLTAYFVFSGNGTNSFPIILNDELTSLIELSLDQKGNSLFARFDNATQPFNVTGYVDSTPTLIEVYVNESDAVLTLVSPVNGSPLVLPRDGTNFNTLGTLKVGGCQSVNTPFSLYISEILLYDDILSSTNRETMRKYLCRKWGLPPPISSDILGGNASVSMNSTGATEVYNGLSDDSAYLIPTDENFVFTLYEVPYGQDQTGSGAIYWNTGGVLTFGANDGTTPWEATTGPAILFGNGTRGLNSLYVFPMDTSGNFIFTRILVNFQNDFTDGTPNTGQMRITLIRNTVSGAQYIEGRVYKGSGGANSGGITTPGDDTYTSNFWEVTNGTSFQTVEGLGNLYATTFPADNKSFVFASDITGNTWTFHPNTHMNVPT